MKNNQDDNNPFIIQRLDRIESKVDKVDERINFIDRTLAVNTESLIQHMRRTSLIEADIKPIKIHVHRVEGALKLFGLISLLVGIAAGLLKIFGIF